MQEEKRGTAPPNTAFQPEAPCLDSYRSLETIASAYKKAYEGKLKYYVVVELSVGITIS